MFGCRSITLSKELPGNRHGEVEGAILKLRKVKSRNATWVLALGEDGERLFAVQADLLKSDAMTPTFGAKYTQHVFSLKEPILIHNVF